jgi:hypothetical protein
MNVRFISIVVTNVPLTPSPCLISSIVQYGNGLPRLVVTNYLALASVILYPSVQYAQVFSTHLNGNETTRFIGNCYSSKAIKVH